MKRWHWNIYEKIHFVTKMTNNTAAYLIDAVRRRLWSGQFVSEGQTVLPGDVHIPLETEGGQVVELLMKISCEPGHCYGKPSELQLIEPSFTENTMLKHWRRCIYLHNHTILPLTWLVFNRLAWQSGHTWLGRSVVIQWIIYNLSESTGTRGQRV